MIDLLKPFANYAATLPVSLPDRALQGMGELNAGDYRNALAVYREHPGDVSRVNAALEPFARAGAGIPEKARDWNFGTSPLTYGDFMRAKVLAEI